MASLLSNLNPVPSFPPYSGPYKVGTIDVEIPVSQLESPSSAPDGSAEIHTVLFRIFYPAMPEPRAKQVSWLPAPQRLNIAAYAQFMGAGNTLASLLSYVPSTEILCVLLLVGQALMSPQFPPPAPALDIDPGVQERSLSASHPRKVGNKMANHDLLSRARREPQRLQLLCRFTRLIRRRRGLPRAPRWQRHPFARSRP